MKRKNLLLIIILAVLILLAGIGYTVWSSLQDNLNQLDSLSIGSINLQTIADGTYTGHYSAFPVTATVVVTVKEHAISAIQLTEHNNGQGQPAERITDDVLAAQSLDVDVVAGATYSSKVILKAIETALSPGGQ